MRRSRGSGRRSTMPRASSRSIRRATVIGSTSSNSASSFCEMPGWRSSQIRMPHCARVMPCGAGALVGVDPQQAGDVVQQEQQIAFEVVQGSGRPSGEITAVTIRSRYDIRARRFAMQSAQGRSADVGEDRK